MRSQKESCTRQSLQNVTVFRSLAGSYQDLERLKQDVRVENLATILPRTHKHHGKLSVISVRRWQCQQGLAKTWQDPGKNFAPVAMPHK